MPFIPKLQTSIRDADPVPSKQTILLFLLSLPDTFLSTHFCLVDYGFENWICPHAEDNTLIFLPTKTV